MDFGDIAPQSPENLSDPVDVQPMAMGFENLGLILSQSVHLRLFAVAAPFGAARDNGLRSRTRRRPRPRVKPGSDGVWFMRQMVFCQQYPAAGFRFSVLSPKDRFDRLKRTFLQQIHDILGAKPFTTLHDE